ncbi:ABC transporter permease [Microbacterium tumbae]
MHVSYWVGRIAILPLMCLAISFITFAMVYLAPGDVAALMAGPRADAAQIDRIRQEMGLDQPFLAQFSAYIGRVATGDLGTTAAGTPVATVIATNAGPTVLLISISIVMCVVLTVGASLLAARRPGGIADGVIRIMSTALLGMPAFWTGIMLLLFLALPTGWFPVGGWPDSFGGQVRATVLPALALTLTIIPVLIRGLRSSLIGVHRSDYVALGRSLGLHGAPLTARYVFRNATVPIIPLVAVMLATLIGSTAVIEATFGLPGLGQALVNGAVQREASLVQGITLILGVCVVLIQFAADLVLALVDPRVRLR